MQEVLQKLQKELERAQKDLDHYEARRNMMAMGSAGWRMCNEAREFHKGEVNGVKFAIYAIERAGATI